VTDIAGDGVAFKVDPGMRAVSVEVKDVVTVGGNVQPGDRVDVVGIFQVQDVQAANDLLAQLGMTQKVVAPTLPAGGEVVGGGSGLYLTLTMLQNVKLLGVDQALTETTAGGDLADSVDKSNSDNSEPGASTATLELTPKQAQDISWADQFGVLRFTGRPAGESSVDAVAPTLVRVDQTR
jgi:Flp pilus assembly protein CpaB